MSDQLPLFEPMISEASPNATSSPGSGSGATPCASPDGLTTGPSGPARAPASRSARQAKAKEPPTPATCGLSGSGSSASIALSQSLASRLQQQFDMIGSILFRQTWKVLTTPSGRQYWAHTASAHRTSDSGCTSWPTTGAMDASGTRRPKDLLATHRPSGAKVCQTLNHAAFLASWPTPNAGPQNDTDSRWMERRAECKEKHTNGNGFGMTLGMAVSMASWPTPNTRDHHAQGATHNERAQSSSLATRIEKKAPPLAGWNTPRATDGSNGGPNQAGGPLPADAARVSPRATPTTRDHKDGACQEQIENGTVPVNSLLGRQVLLTSWATPKSTDGKGETYEKQPDDRRVELRHQAFGLPATGSPASTERRGQLNPAHSRWLMGLPAAWDDCAPTETPSMLKRRQLS